MMSSTKGAQHVVSIIVYGAKGLKPKKDKHKFCVIFGVGKSKYKTDIVEDLFDNPVFNKEAEITVDSLDLELKFKVTEKHSKDVLGQVIVPLYELGDQNSSSPHKVPLRPHKKCPTPHGMLIFEASVSAKKQEHVPSRTTSMESLKSIKSLGLSSGLKKLKEKVSGKSSESKSKKQESLFSLKNRSAVSCQDMTRESPFYIGLPTDRKSLQSDVLDVSHHPEVTFDRLSQLSDDFPKRGSIHMEKLNEFTCPRPEITGISPRCGPETGGTVVTIRGTDLGQNQDDIIALHVCGSDVLSTLEYISPWKLQCKTLPWKPCIGSFNIETLSGGRGTSMTQFTFNEVEKPETTSDSDRGVLHDVNKSRKTEVYATSYDDSNYANDVTSSDHVTGSFEPSMDTWDKPTIIISDLDSEQVLDSTVGSPQTGGSIALDGENFSHKNDESVKNSAKVEEPVAYDVFNQKSENSRDTLDEGGSNMIRQNSGFLSSVENGVGSERLDGKVVVPAKQPPPIVEIQPMRMEEKSRKLSKDSDDIPPRKPPRGNPDRRSSIQNEADEIMHMLIRSTNFDQEDMSTHKRSEKDEAIIKDLESQLLKKNKEIAVLMDLKKSLLDENWRLKQYIEAVVMRAISICPEVLCVDDSFA